MSEQDSSHQVIKITLLDRRRIKSPVLGMPGAVQAGGDNEYSNDV